MELDVYEKLATFLRRMAQSGDVGEYYVVNDIKRVVAEFRPRPDSFIAPRLNVTVTTKSHFTIE